MRERKDKNTIFPLSPDSTLSSIENIRVYFGFLKDALEGEKKCRIHNIAVTGGFGTGKSSLIRSYEQDKLKKEQEEFKNEQKKFEKEHPIWAFISRFPTKFKSVLNWILFHCSIFAPIVRGKSDNHKDTDEDFTSRFLYVSVGEYESDAKKKEKQKAPKGGTKEQEDTSSIRTIERRMLLQIFARFRRADLPQSSFRLVPEAWTKRLWLIAVLFGCFVFSMLLLCFHEQLGGLLVAVNSMEGGGKCSAWIMVSLVKYKTLFRLLLSAYCICLGALASGFLFFRILPRIRFHALTVKGVNVELSLEKEAAESYLDLYSMELVYCLEKIAEKIDHIVVFEDLDRLDSGDCLYILTRLREINNLVNLRLQKNGEPLRFIYAVNDDFFGTVQHEKFFDYILPVIPEMNKRSAAVLFAEKIKKLDEEYDVLKAFPQFEIVASCLSDYRLQNTILNEYQVLKELYTATIADGSELDNPQKNEILAFAIYKNCWPGDYHAIRTNNSSIFTSEGIKCPKEFKDGKYGNLLVELADQNNHLLTLHSLYFIGFSEEELSKSYRSNWEKNVQFSKKNCDQYLNDLNSFREGDTKCIEEAGVFLIDQIVSIDPDTYNANVVEPFRGLITCVTHCKYCENRWFTRRTESTPRVPFFPLMTWLKLLSMLTDVSDEDIKNKFVSLFLEENRITKTRFCDDEELQSLSLSYLTLKELCRAISAFPSSTCFYVDENEISNPEESDIVKRIRAELALVQ